MQYKYYDSQKKQIIFLGAKATPAFWDKRWDKDNLKKEIASKKYNPIVLPTTKKYLSAKSKILEGGCGHGTFVYHLSKNGYDCIGVDFAQETIIKIKKLFPALNVECQNLERLKFPNNYFDGYWSIGVIEHFYSGYEKITKEMQRVIKPKGFLFVTFPYMSPLRKLNVKLNKYPKANFKGEPKNFYQFALDHKTVINNLEKKGFVLVNQKPFDGFRGLKSELPILDFVLDPIDKLSQKSIFVLALRFLIARSVQPFASHSLLLVFQKK